MRFARLDDWLRWLETQHPREIDLGLERVAAVAKALNISLSMPVLTVAGTNGKGSCVALAAAILSAEGYRVGTYTSPHLVDYNERIVIAGERVADAPLIAAFAAIDAARGEISLSYFEFGTLAALWLFQDAALDAVVLEIGLGGRLDAVNIVDADVAIVSSIAIDHEAWLGSDREVIAREKAGVFRAGHAAVVGDLDPPKSLLAYGREIGAKMLCRGHDFSFIDAGHQWQWRGVGAGGEAIKYLDLPVPRILLDNAAAVLQALQYLDLAVSEASLRQGLALASVPGRCQHFVVNGVDIVLDVAHNPAAVVTLRQHLQTRPVSGRCQGVFAVMADKAIAEMIGILEPCFDNWVLATLAGNGRAASAEYVAALLAEQLIEPVDVGGTVAESVERGLAESRPGDRLVIFGSFFTVAEAMTYLSAHEGFALNSAMAGRGNTL
ncbi:bifunctional tetrahydrofolate synthase/dihydrofolate synthase [Zhongshania borealis]|uniref:Dihydrofolate synthase/folylpolyglutamate synthase n=1 Tax=Zhongshania borealis TaxID=889488 RepID=A0ABP7W9G5_9GAMM